MKSYKNKTLSHKKTHLAVLILLFIVIWMMVLGCGRAPRYDQRLVQADSLMQPDPDSALAIIEAVNRDSLAGEDDRAYRDLLLTQARYRCYIVATSDSDINRALDHYRRHSGEREKLTRAYIYKGAVMDELGHPDSAMYYYKHAEATAAPDDYFNLGYVKMRMGALYRDNYAMDGQDITKYSEALECFNQTNDSSYQLRCLVNLGSLCCLSFPHKADSLLNSAMSLAKQLKDTVAYLGAVQNLIKNDIGRDRYDHAFGWIRKVMSMENPKLSIPFCLYAAQTYACLQMPDSAELFLNLTQESPINNVLDEICYLEAQRDIAQARGHTSRYLFYKEVCIHKTDSLMALSAPLSIISAENEVDHRLHHLTRLSLENSAQWVKILLLSIITFLMAGAVFYYKRRTIHKKQLKQLMELLDSSQSQLAEVKQSLDELNKLDVKDEKLKDVLNAYMVMMRSVMEECYHQPKSINAQRLRKVIQFQKKNKGLWEKLYAYIDIEYNGIISKTKINYPQLNDTDLLLIAMSTLKFSYIQIALIMGYTNATSVSVIRQRLAQKMGLACSLNDYIESHMHN